MNFRWLIFWLFEHSFDFKTFTRIVWFTNAYFPNKTDSLTILELEDYLWDDFGILGLRFQRYMILHLIKWSFEGIQIFSLAKFEPRRKSVQKFDTESKGIPFNPFPLNNQFDNRKLYEQEAWDCVLVGSWNVTSELTTQKMPCFRLTLSCLNSYLKLIEIKNTRILR